MSTQLPSVGKPIDRVDGRLKVTGKARFAAEFNPPGLVHGVLVQSTIAKGRVAEIDTAAAEKLPGVVAVLTHKNAPKLKEVPPNPRSGSSQSPGTEFQLQDDRVRYFGQNVALVLADTLERAQDAAARVKVRYEKEAHATDPTAALDKAVPPKSDRKDEPAAVARGDFDTAFAAAPVRIDATFTTAQENHNPMEPHATVAVWDGPKVTVYDATQYVSGVQESVAAALDVGRDDVRVVCLFTGGGFGCKGNTWPHVILAAAAARHVGRPVKLALTRQQMFTSVGYRPFTSQRVRLGATKDGTLAAVSLSGVNPVARYGEFTELVGSVARMMYAAPAIAVATRVIPLDVQVPTYMRAPGESTGSLAFEVAVDEMAYAVGLDPLEFRLKNHADTHPTEDKPWSSKSLKECYRIGAEKFGWAKRDPKPGAMRDGRLLVGYGMASSTYPVHLFPAKARVTLAADGTATVESGTQDLGTGSYTIFTQVAAEILGLPVEKVRCRIGDSTLPRAGVSGGSSTAGSVGSAVRAAAEELRDKLVALATADAKSPLKGLKPEAVVVADGRLVAKDDATRGEAYTAILARAGKKPVTGEGELKQDRAKKFDSHAFGAIFAEVGVDPDFGTARVRRMFGAFAAGRILNAKTTRSQYIGGMIFGIGTALLEHTVTDHRTGLIVTREFADYLVPVNADAPAVDAVIVPEEDPHTNGVGTKGVGEIGNVGSAAAVANAVFHATGKRVRDFPITLDKLL
ncbi:MAG: aldehyde oxidase and xanthine dehydrogenase, molybdopterin binding [Gemmataceae bacterium]|nr:aldehyde oxidase and xanthine dehydrogenase, molybdopterin binding [Gemmataceae bacterium]